MGRMSQEQKLADRIALVMGHVSFEPWRFALHWHRCGYVIQGVMMECMKGIIMHWSTDYDNGVTRDSDDYLRLTIRAKQLQDVIDRWG